MSEKKDPGMCGQEITAAVVAAVDSGWVGWVECGGFVGIH